MLKRFFSAILKLVSTLAACCAAAFVVVFPLWKWAVKSPRTYTAVVLAAFVIAVVAALFYRFKSNRKTGKTRNKQNNEFQAENEKREY